MLPIQSMNDLQVIGQTIAQSNLIGIDNPAAGMVVAMTCYQEEMTILDFGRTYHIIGGKTAKRADAIAAQFRMRGGRYDRIENSSTRAAAKFVFEDKESIHEFTIEDANRAELTNTKNDNWRKYPQNMLWARMMSNAIRILCPEIIYGSYTPEEIQDMQAENSVAGAEVETIDPAEAARRMQAMAGTEPAIDYEVCPLEVNGHHGYRFEELPNETLLWFLSPECIDERVTQGHTEVIQRILKERGVVK